jgi:hypothetical protein
MRSHVIRIACLLALGCAVAGLPARGRADPMLRSGIGLASCAKLAADLKVGGGLAHLPNALLFYWAQGYISAANIHMLNENTDYVDAGAIDEPMITKLVVEFCQANPDKRPVNAIDKFLQDAKKIEAKESEAFNPWEH